MVSAWIENNVQLPLGRKIPSLFIFSICLYEGGDTMFIRKYSDNWIDYPGKGRIADKDIWNYVKKHSSLLARLDPHRMVDAALDAQLILMGVVDEKESLNYKNGKIRF
jgi:hypothetical protein